MERFLILRIGGVGDNLLLLPFLAALRETYPRAYREFIGYPERIRIFQDFGFVDGIKSFDQPGMSSFFLKEGNPPGELLSYFKSFDTIYFFLKDENGIFRENLGKYGIENFHLFSPYPKKNIHILDYYDNLIHSLGMKKNRSNCLLFRIDEDRIPGQMPAEQKKHSIIIHPGAGSKKKCWPAKYFAEIIDWLEKKYIMKTRLISGPADENIAREVVRHLNKTKPEIIKNRSLSELALFFSQYSFYLGNDSGITHLAAFSGIPTIAIFNRGNARTWSPRGKNVQLCVSDNLENISPLVIKEKLSKLLQANNANESE